MNRSLCFSVSFVAHVTCVGLLLLTSKPGTEKPIIMEACRVTLFSPQVSTPSSPPSKREVKTPTRRRATKNVRPKPEPKPVIITRKRRKPPPPVEPSYDPPEIGKLEKETLRTPPLRTVREPAGMGKLLVSSGGTSSFDAYIAGIIKSNWVRPSRAVVGENPRPVSVAIRIAMDGRITSWRVTRGSGSASLDDSAVKAIERSKRLPIGLPRHMGRRFYDVTIVFRVTDEA